MSDSPLAQFRVLKSQLSLLEKIGAAKDEDGAWDALEALVTSLGLDYCGIGVIDERRTDRPIRLDHAEGRFKRSFDQYCSVGFDRIDPSVELVSQAKIPVLTARYLAGLRDRRQTAATHILQHLQNDGFEAHAAMQLYGSRGSAVGIFGFGRINGVPDDAQSAMVARNAPLLRVAAHGFLAASKEAAPQDTYLTAREREVLLMLSKGLSPNEIAEEQGRALATVRSQISSAKRRLGARTALQAVLLAERAGLIRA